MGGGIALARHPLFLLMEKTFKLRTACALLVFSLIVKGSGMRVEEVEKNGGKEDGSPTMPLMLFSFYRVIRSWR
ncbi:hypothetical protein, partial [Intestinicryptomonas porci]|nr:hypothetical protein [Opitutales bacterium CLA-KB-P66]